MMRTTGRTQEPVKSLSNRMPRGRVPLLAAALPALVAAFGPAQAQEPAAPRWEFSLTPYLWIAGVTGTLPVPLTADYVKLPYKNPPGRHPKTGLTKGAAALCTWVVSVAPEDIHGRSGFVPPAIMAVVHSKTAAMAKAVGGWP